VGKAIPTENYPRGGRLATAPSWARPPTAPVAAATPQTTAYGSWKRTVRRWCVYLPPKCAGPGKNGLLLFTCFLRECVLHKKHQGTAKSTREV
jgi:hypothetical protein